MKTLLERIFITNWKTSLCGGLLVFALVGRYTGKLDSADFQYTVGICVAAGLFAAKDGVREDKVVAREDIIEE